MVLIWSQVGRQRDATDRNQKRVDIMRAYLYNAPKALHAEGKKKQLLIGTSSQDIKHSFIVKGTKEANEIAKQFNAQRWNY